MKGDARGMSLPDLIEIVPLTKPVQAQITVPGSKSITNRALILAALASGKTTLQGALWSEDTQVMVECLQKLGFAINVAPDPDEPCNRTITVHGQGGKIPKAGTVEQPLELFVGNAGTAARFLSALVCLGDGVYRLHGVPRMHERPQAALFDALRELGYQIDSPNNKLPAIIHGRSRGNETLTKKSGKDQRLLTSSPTSDESRSCKVSIEESSQFASALLLCASVGGWEIQVIGENAEESPYVAMTSKLIEAFPQNGGTSQIEPDASSGSYFWAAGWMVGQRRAERDSSLYIPWKALLSAGLSVTVNNWPSSTWQIDSQFPKYLPLPLSLSRQNDLGDSIMTAVIISADYESARASFGHRGDDVLEKSIKDGYRYPVISFRDLGRLRMQECERVVALRVELTKCGAEVLELEDFLAVAPSRLHGAEIETYNDHRMAMCFAILGLKVPGIKIKNPACVKKTFPNFFQKLAAAPPAGLGATILDARTQRPLSGDELFAD